MHYSNFNNGDNNNDNINLLLDLHRKFNHKHIIKLYVNQLDITYTVAVCNKYREH